MGNYTAKDAARSVKAMPSGWVGAIPTLPTTIPKRNDAHTKQEIVEDLRLTTIDRL